jgi:putative transport protein
MLAWMEQFLVRYPELALFLVIAAGYWIGSIHIGAFSLGPVTGALFAGLFVGQFAVVPVSGMLKSFLFLLFLFGVGYSVGPQFMPSLKRNGVKPVFLVLIVCVTGLVAAILVSKVLGLDPGMAAGLTSGALTQSAAMGTATDAINALALPQASRELLAAHVAVADAVCYIFGYAGVILFLTTVAPALLKIDLRAESLKLEEELGMTHARPDLASGWRKFELRAYRLREGLPILGLTIAAAEARTPAHRLFIQRVRRGDSIIEATPGLVIAANDVIALSGPREIIVDQIGSLAVEVEDRELLEMPIVSADVLLMNPKLAGTTLSDASKKDWARGLYLRSLKRGSQDIPIASGIVLERGDVLRIVGPEAVIARATKEIGANIAIGTVTDFVVLGLAIFIGGLVGVLLTFTVGGIKISLSSSIGALLAGLLVGHLRTSYPLFARIPDGAVAFMTSLGLAAFVGLTGLHAGPIFVQAVREAGIGLLVGGAIVTLLPQIVGLLCGHFALRMNPILLLGSLSGAQTVTAAMAALQQRAGSPVPVLGYTTAYPLANILLTTWGTVVVVIMAS